jgi:S-formylglutathione hydrolase FrmB
VHGTLQLREVDAPALTSNPLGDSTRRTTPIYLPPGYSKGSKRFPSVYFLHGFMGSGLGWLNVSPFSPNLVERLDDLIGRQAIPPVIGVFADGWTSFGGSQWTNSEAIGRYRDYVAADLVHYIDREFSTVPSSNSRALIGKSSGGYGVWVIACHHPEIFGHVAAHSADAYFEYCYLPEFPKAAWSLQKANGVEPWFTEFKKRARETKMRSDDFPVIDIVAMAAAYSPRRGLPLNLELPFELATGRLRPGIWDRWLQCDPVQFVPKSVESLRKLKSIFMDCGTRDEFYLQWGARMLADELRAAKIDHLHEEFEDGHLGTTYRYDRSLLYLVPRLQSH